MKLFDKIPIWLLLVPALVLGFAPFQPQPHLVEKVIMLMQGQLVEFIDIFDLLWHGVFPLLFLVKLIREIQLVYSAKR
ncbi:MAG: RND transporter [Gammaproteobacteria bacterium]|nr:RND transporter [Gammaproteobacteria bacterium]